MHNKRLDPALHLKDYPIYVYEKNALCRLFLKVLSFVLRSSRFPDNLIEYTFLN